MVPVPEAVQGLLPLRGEIVPIKSIQETQAAEEFGEAYVAEVNVKSASKVIKALDAAFTRDPSVSLQHLRRFAKREQLPDTLREQLAQGEAVASPQTIFVLIPPPLPNADAVQNVLAPFVPADRPDMEEPPSVPGSHLDCRRVRLSSIRVPLQAPVNALQAKKWSQSLWPVTYNPAAARAATAPPPQILYRVLESIASSAGYYLSLAQKVAEEAEQSGRGRAIGAVVVDPSIEIAAMASAESAAGQGDTSTEHDYRLEAVVAVAGDARYARRESGSVAPPTDAHAGSGPNPASFVYNADLEGGPELHPLMRAVDMVARRRREKEEDDQAEPTDVSDWPSLSPLESYFLYQADDYNPPSKRLKTNAQEEQAAQLSIDITSAAAPTSQTPTISSESSHLVRPQSSALNPSHPQSRPSPPPSLQKSQHAPATRRRILSRSQGGYLCTDLDLYVSHEPCVSCCMGMLLSRFRAVVFPRRGRLATGGLASEPAATPLREMDADAGAGAGAIPSPGQPVPRDEEERGGASGFDGAAQAAACERSNYYGLHWRKELNWRALGFEFVEQSRADLCPLHPPELLFHA